MNANSLLMPRPAQVPPLLLNHIVGSVRPKPDDVVLSNRKLTTAELAAALSMREQSIRKRLSQTGSYFGIRPVKLPNGRLRWPTDSVGRLIALSERSSEGSIK